MIEYPFNLGARKIRVNHQTRIASNIGLEPFFFEAFTYICSALILPYDGIVNGLSSILVPDYGSFSLIGYTNGGNIRIAKTILTNQIVKRLKLCFKNFYGVVFYPSWFRNCLLYTSPSPRDA